MHRSPQPTVALFRTALAAAAACCALAGCRGIPRIDPSGQRCLIWPDEAAVNTPLVAPGNVVVAPVTTDPVFPAAPVVAAPVASTPGIIPAAAAIAATPQDKLTITPDRVLAPVGSEVVLKASICTTEGYTLADQKIEWMLGRNGVGQFVELGGKGCIHPPLLPWNKGTKVDNYLAQGYTATAPLCIDRGTADPTDDVNINRGDAWISVTSPNEGTSHVTAYTPAVESWDFRKSAAVIYWVDVQWTFPAASVTSSGRPELLTTTVVRQTDATPLPGWIVRYAVEGAPEQTREVVVGADGRATVEVAPTATGAPSSRVDVELIRPQGFGGGDAPRLVVARGTTIVNWSSGSYVPGGTTTAPATPMPTIPTYPAPSSPITPGSPYPSQPAPVQPAPTQPAAGPARLELNVAGPQQVEVGGVAQFVLNVRNAGQSPATGISLTVDFPAELSSNADTEGTRRIAWPTDGQSLTLRPGEQRELPVPLNVLRAGQICPTMTAAYNEGSPETKRPCFTAVDPQNQRQGRVSLSMTGPTQMTVGETATFTVIVQNTGELPLVNLEVTEEYPTAHFQATPAEPNVQPVSGIISRFIPRLEVGARKEFRVNCRAVAATARVRPMATVRAQTDPPSGAAIETSREAPLAIVPPSGAASPGGAAPAPGAPGANLSVRVNFPQATIQAGSRATCEVVVTNVSTAADRNVTVRVSFPPELTPDLTAIKAPPNVQASLDGNNVLFTPVPTIAAQERIQFQIPVNAVGTGIKLQVIAGAASTASPEVVDGRFTLEIVGRRA